MKQQIKLTEDYEALKKENQELRERCARAELILGRLRIPAKVLERMNPSTVRRWSRKNPVDYMTRVHIEFDVCDFELGDI